MPTNRGVPSGGKIKMEMTAPLQWIPFNKEDATYFEPSKKDFMMNFRVENPYGLLETLKTEDVQVLDNTESAEEGKFGWIGILNDKIELWEPIDKAFSLENYKKILKWEAYITHNLIIIPIDSLLKAENGKSLGIRTSKVRAA